MLIDSFDGQREDEEIVDVWRAQAFTLSRPAWGIIAFVVFGSIPMLTWHPSWSVGFLLFFIAIAGLYAVHNYYLWLNTIYILTNQRVFAITQSSLFSRKNSELALENIQTVSHTKKGIWQMLLNFGNVEIQTAGTAAMMILKNVENPYRIQQKILNK
jgi:uncharacterized membrane protein YdbT with pleckstrin-like domain